MFDQRIIGLDLGGTKCAVPEWHDGRKTREHHRFRTAGPRETLSEIVRAIERLGPEAKVRQVLHAETLPDSLRACCIAPSSLGENLGGFGAIAAGLNGSDRFHRLNECRLRLFPSAAIAILTEPARATQTFRG